MRRNLLSMKLIKVHLRAELGPVNLTALEFSTESYLDSIVQGKI